MRKRRRLVAVGIAFAAVIAAIALASADRCFEGQQDSARAGYRGRRRRRDSSLAGAQ
jgi:hypothetical protein